MPTGNEPNPDQLIVKARYFVAGEIEERNLRTLQQDITRVLRHEGYRQTDVDPLPIGPVQKTMDFKQFEGIPIEPSKSFSDKIKHIFTSRNGQMNAEDITEEDFLDGLKRARDDLPFRLIFHFRPYEESDIEGYDIEIESIPVLLQKYRQLPVRDDYSYNTKDIVSQNKREIKRIMGRLGLEPLHEPYTESETLEVDLEQTYRKFLSSLDYGEAVLQYLDEGDECFQRELYHAALNCYIHAIEWTMIVYIKQWKGKDVIEEQKQDDKQYYFYHLVNMLQDDTSIEQTTMESLEQYKDTERHWIAHHRSGDIRESKVEEVRDTLIGMIEELFNPRN